MLVRCPQCNCQLRVPADSQKVTCNSCRARFRVDGQGATVLSEPGRATRMTEDLDSPARRDPEATRATAFDASAADTIMAPAEQQPPDTREESTTGPPEQPDDDSPPTERTLQDTVVTRVPDESGELDDRSARDTLATGPPEDPTGPEAPTMTTAGQRINCPDCGAEFTAPVQASVCTCPECGHRTDTTGASGGAMLTTLERDRAGGKKKRKRRHKAPDAAAAELLRQNLSGSYEILGLLGHGGMGAVYHARQLVPEREVALKVMLTGPFTSERYRKRFAREARAVARLRHPAIVPVYEYGEVGGQPFFTMEYVDGEDLRKYCREQDLNRNQICRLVVRVCDALHYAHQHGVVHRDIKPANILVDDLERPRILDFGLSRLVEEEQEALTVTGDFLGTPRYMSPEQALGRAHDVDQRTDVYSLGVILFELVVGVLPYPIENVKGLKFLDVLRSATAVTPRDLHQDLPRDLELILLKAVEKDPARRYQSAEELAEDLEAFLDGRPISARPATAGYRLKLWAHRNRKVLVPAAVAGVVALLVALGFVGYMQGLIEQIRRDRATVREARKVEQRYVQGAERGMAVIDNALDEGDWRGAALLARSAPQLWPDLEGMAFLEDRVWLQARETVQQHAARLRTHLEQQNYERAAQQENRLTELAERLPFSDLQERARATMEAPRTERAWHALRHRLSTGYRPDRMVEALDRFLAWAETAGAAPALRQEARAMRARLSEMSAEELLRRHRAAFAERMSTHDWAGARAVVESLGENRSAGPAWQQAHRRLHEQLHSVIRPQTAARLEPLAPLATTDAGGTTRARRAAEALFAGPDMLVVQGALPPRVRVWQPRERRVVGEVNYGEREYGERAYVRAVALNPDGLRLTIARKGQPLEVRRLPALGPPEQVVPGVSSRIINASYSPDGRLLALADVEKVVLLNAKGEPVEAPGLAGNRLAAFSPVETLLATGIGKAGVAVWRRDFRSGGWYALHRFALQAEPHRVEWSPDGRLLAAVAKRHSGRAQVHVWRVADGADAGSFVAGPDPVTTLAFSPDGRLLAWGGKDNTAHVRDLAGGRELWNDRGGRAFVSALAFSPDARLLVVGRSGASVQDVDTMLWHVPPTPAAADSD